MKIMLKSTLSKCAALVVVTSLVVGCSATKKHEQEAQLKADKAGLTVVEKTRFDGTFIAKGAEENAKFSETLSRSGTEKNTEELRENFILPWRL